jgi:hypothetical protein
MDLNQLSQFGIAGIFIAASWKLYSDMRIDSTAREQKLMEHLDKVTDTQEGIKTTMQSIETGMKGIHERLCEVEDCVRKDGIK